MRLVKHIVILGTLLIGGVAAAVGNAPVAVNIPSQSLSDALNELAAQTGLQLIFNVEEVLPEEVAAPEVKGTLTPEAALQALLANTGLKYKFIDARTVALSVGKGRETVDLAMPGMVTRVAQVEESQEGQEEGARGLEESEEEENEMGEGKGIPEILVIGSKMGSLNMDIRRSEDDAQPYVVFDREVIAKSSAANLEEFFKHELTMSTSAVSANQSYDQGNRSTVNLRGMGTDETLILIDGRRLAGFNHNGHPVQPDINGIPLAAVERIEVLPTTASGIYGGGATGGVINIVLRRDYSSLQTKLTYGNSFGSDVATRRAEVTGGFNLEGGKTNVLVAASYSDANTLTNGERDLLVRGRQHVLASNPAFFFDGDPPLGHTTNIRSNHVVNDVRQNLTLDDGTPLNSPITFVPEGYGGWSIDGGAAFLVNAGQYNLELADTAQFNGSQQALLSSPAVKSVMLTVRREFTPRVQAFLDLHTSQSETTRLLSWGLSGLGSIVTIAADAPNNPFQQAITVSVPTVGLLAETRSKSEDFRAVSGLIVRLPGEWQAELDFSWNRSRSSYSDPGLVTSSTVAAVRSGSLDVLRDVNAFPISIETSPIPRNASFPAETTVKDTTLRIAGALAWSLPGGNPVISMLLEHREEMLGDILRIGFARELFTPSRWQSVDSAYLEAKIPIVSGRNKVRGIELLDLQLAARWDDYYVNGVTHFIDLQAPQPVVRLKNEASSIDPTIALRYSPAQDLMVRASYGTGYLPPSVTQLVPTEFPPFVPGLVDPLRDNEPVGEIVFLTGGNPNLQPESSKSWSGGLIFTPHWIPDLRVSVDWSLIEKRGNIGYLDLTSQSGLNDGITYFPERIIRGEPSDGFSVGPIIELNASAINVAQLRSESVDLKLDYRVETHHIGVIDLSARATNLISLESQDTPASPIVENAGVSSVFGGSSGGAGLKWSANSSIVWAYGGWDLGWRGRFFDSYFLDRSHAINANQGAAKVPSQTYHDVFGGYRFPSSSGTSLFSDLQIRFGISNVFNKKPPVDVSVPGYWYSPFGDPRLANYYVSVTKSFLAD